jgi:hypothetical protein
MQILLQETVFPIRREIRLRCEPTGLRISHPEDGGDMFLRNISFERTTRRRYIPEDNILHQSLTFSRIFQNIWETRALYIVHKIPPLVLNLSQINPALTLFT